MRNINWSFVGFQTLVTIICMKLAEIVFQFQTPDLLLPGCQILLAVTLLLLFRNHVRGSFQTLEIYVGTIIGYILLNQNFNWLGAGIALVAIWLLEQNEQKPGSLPKEHYLWTTIAFLICAILAWYCFGSGSLKWIITGFIGWIFQMTSQLSKSFEWHTNSSLWYPIQNHSPKLWIIGFLIANYGMTGLIFLDRNINLALALVLGKILQKDKIGRWISVTRVIAVFLIILPELLQNMFQFLLQYY
jgi:hypothetical protein